MKALKRGATILFSILLWVVILLAALFADFNKTYPNITVNLNTYSGDARPFAG